MATVKETEIKTFKDVKFDLCDKGACKDWLGNFSIFIKLDPKSNIETLHFHAAVTNIVAISEWTTKLTLLFSDKTDKASPTELFGCRWLPNESMGKPGDCESAVSKDNLDDWHNYKFGNPKLAIDN